METNEITGQGQPVQVQQFHLQPELQPTPASTGSEQEPTPTLTPLQSEQAEQPAAPCVQSPVQTQIEQNEQPEQPPLYDPGVVARMAELIRDVFDPAYILLFGTLAKGTPHSDALSYDILIATHETPQYNWLDVRRYLKMKMPSVGRGVPYLNIYLHPANYVISQSSPFLRLARTEGILLYRSDRHKFRRPRKPYSFSQAACDAKQYYKTFIVLGAEFLEQADTALTENKIRQAAFAAAQAAVCFYQVLFRVYHGFDFDTHDIMLMHERTRTLSAELLLLFESDSFTPVDTLPCLRRFIINARYESSFFIHVTELEEHFTRVKRMQGIVEKLCLQRIDLYNRLDEQSEQ